MAKEGPSETLGERLRHELGLELYDPGDGKQALRAEGTSLMVMQLVTKHGEEYERGKRRAMELVRQQLPPSARRTRLHRCQGAEGSAFLLRCMHALEAEGRRISAQRLPAYYWIWMIRRLPLSPLWRDQGIVNVRLLLTTLATADNSLPGITLPDGLIPLSKGHGRALAFLLGFVEVLVGLEMCYRWVGKGAYAECSFEQHRVWVRADEEMWDALKDYDQQVLTEGGWGGFGLHHPELSPDSMVVDADAGGPIALLFALNRARWKAGTTAADFKLERYLERFVHLEEAFGILAGPDSPPIELLDPELGPLLALLAAYRPLRDAGGLTTQTVRMVGYSVHVGNEHFAAPTSKLHSGLQAGLDVARERLPGLAPASIEDVWRRLRGMRPALSPRRPGPVIMKVNEGAVLIDWYVAATRFLLALRYPKVSGAAAQVRADAFEESVRSAIGRTACRPASWLQEYIGRHLRKKGAHDAFGEFDAAATLPDSAVHLIVFCKSYALTDDYFRGDHAAVRNVSERLAEDVLRALNLAKTLREHPVGANYAIPSGSALYPVVVTPRPMYCALPAAQRRWFSDEWGPRLLSGVGGLLAFLNGYEQPDE